MRFSFPSRIPSLGCDKMVSEQDYPRQQMVWSDWCGWYVPSKPPKFLPALAADRPYSSSASARRPWPSRSIASSSSSLSGYGGGPYRQEMGVIGLGSSACKIPSRFQSESALEPYLPRQIPDSSDLRRRRGPAELALAVSGPDRREVKVPHSTPGKIPNPSSDLGKMKEWVVSYEEDASDPTAIWRVISATNYKADVGQHQLGKLEMARRVDDMRLINVRSTPEGNYNNLSTGFSVVVSGWGQDPLPCSLASSTGNHQTLSQEPASDRQWLQNPKENLSQPHPQYQAKQWDSNPSNKRVLSVSTVDDDLSYSNSMKIEQMEQTKVKAKLCSVEYQPRWVPGKEILEQEVYGIDPYTHNLPKEIVPADLDWSIDDKAEEKKGVNESGDEDKINKDIAVKTNFVRANVPDEAKFYLTQLYMVGRDDRWLWSTGLLWKPPPWPDFCAMGCDSVAQHGGYEVLVNFHSVKRYHISLDTAFELNDYCRSHRPPISLIKAEVCGLFGSVFCDFGPEITVLDVDGEDPHTGITASISNDNPALVSCVDDERLEFQDGDLVVLSEVQGMTELIDDKHPFIEERVKVLRSVKLLQLDDMVIGQHKSLHCYFIWLMLEYSKFSSLDSDEPFARKFNNLTHRQLAEFNSLQFKAGYCSEEYTGYAVVLFTKDWNETNPYGKYIYGWLAKEEDYKFGNPVGRFLSEKGDLKAVNDLEHDLTTRVVKDKESVYALVMNDTGPLLVSSGIERVVRVWDPGTGSKNMKMRHEVEEERNMSQLSKVWQQGLFKEPKEKRLHVSGHNWGRIETSGNMLSFNVVTSSNDKGKDMPLEEESAVTWFPEDGHANSEIKLPQNTRQAASVDSRKKESSIKPTNFVENGSYTEDLDEVLVCKSQVSALKISACNSTINEEPVVHSKEVHKSQDADINKDCSQASHNRKSAYNNNSQAAATVVLEPKNSRTSLCVEVEQSKAKASGTDNIKSSKFVPSILTGQEEYIVSLKGASTAGVDHDFSSPDSVLGQPKHVVVGFIGYLHVGKSSIVNALVVVDCIEDVLCGSMVARVGLDQFITNNATLTNEMAYSGKFHSHYQFFYFDSVEPLPASNALSEMKIFHFSSPLKTQKYSVENLYEGSLDDIYATAIKHCDPEGYLMLYIPKMIPGPDMGAEYEELVKAATTENKVQFITTNVRDRARIHFPGIAFEEQFIGLAKSEPEKFGKCDGALEEKAVIQFVDLNKFQLNTAFTELNSAKVYASPIKPQVFTFAEAYDFEDLESMLQEVATGKRDLYAKNVQSTASRKGKNLALMGVSCGHKGTLILIHEDFIAKSNWSRQNLCRDWNIGLAKSTVF